MYRKECGLPSVTIPAVHGVISRMKSTTVSIIWRKQGSLDVSSSISRARCLWCLQLEVIFQIDGYKTFRLDYTKQNNLSEVPKCLDEKELNLISKSDVVWFDGVHRQVLPGSSGVGANIIISSKRTITKFARESYEKIVPNGTIDSDTSTQPMTVKYPVEARFAFGVYMNIDSSSKCIGKRCYVFEYTQKII